MLLLEDLHWADDGSLDALAHLLHNGQPLPLFILSLARPLLYERRPDWGTAGTRLELQPLDASSTGSGDILEAQIGAQQYREMALQDGETLVLTPRKARVFVA